MRQFFEKHGKTIRRIALIIVWISILVMRVNDISWRSRPDYLILPIICILFFALCIWVDIGRGKGK